jgi:hypothetical protein
MANTTVLEASREQALRAFQAYDGKVERLDAAWQRRDLAFQAVISPIPVVVPPGANPSVLVTRRERQAQADLRASLVGLQAASGSALAAVLSGTILAVSPTSKRAAGLTSVLAAGVAAVIMTRNGSVKPKGYSVVYEMELSKADLGRRRGVHFNRANAALDAELAQSADYRALMEQHIPGLSEAVSSSGGRKDPPGHVWHHARSDAAQGRQGVMQLVPDDQHTSGSLWWGALHTGPNYGGGYQEWAVPNGAPKE